MVRTMVRKGAGVRAMIKKGAGSGNEVSGSQGIVRKGAGSGRWALIRPEAVACCTSSDVAAR